MKEFKFNNTIVLFLNYKETINLEKSDLKKIKLVYSSKFESVIIYNYFDVKSSKKLIKDKLNKLKFSNQEIIYARKCIIKYASNDEVNIFLNENHIQGSDKSNIRFGAYYNDELIGVMNFNEKRGVNGSLKKNQYELSRFSIKSGKIITGIFSKILKNFIELYKPTSVISFADLKYVSDSNIYEKNNFKRINTLPPDFKWYNPELNKTNHRITYGTKYKKTKNLSNEQYSEFISKLIKIWDCGKIKYELLIGENQKPIYGFIYRIKNKINSKVYIGQTSRPLNKRIYEYKSSAKRGVLNNKYLQSAFNKYGFNNFIFEIIDNAPNIYDLNKKEIEYIETYDSTNRELGYNLEVGGKNSSPSITQRLALSNRLQGTKQSETWISNRISKKGSEEAKKYGRLKTEEEKEHLSKVSPKYWEGKNRSEITKNKISKTKLEMGLSDEQKRAICKRVLVKTPQGECIAIYDSTSEASKFLAESQSTISRRCSGKSKNKGNYFFYYE